MWEIVLGAAIALSGVVFSEWLTRHRDRRERVRQNIHDLTFTMAIFTAYYSEHPDSPMPDGDYLGPFWTLRQSVLHKLGELRYLPRWPLRNAEQIRENANEMLTYLTAMEMGYQKRGALLSLDEQAAIHMRSKLHSLMFGLGVLPQDKIKHYRDHGFGELVAEMWAEEE